VAWSGVEGFLMLGLCQAGWHWPDCYIPGACQVLNTAPLTRSPGLDINEEWLDFGRDADVVEEEVRGGVAAP
jgi:hypothetical protein